MLKQKTKLQKTMIKWENNEIKKNDIKGDPFY